MLASPSTHVILVAVGLIGTVVLGLAFRKKKAAAAPLLWIVPFALTFSATDGALAALASWWPSMAMDHGDGDVLRFVLAYLVLLAPIEVFYQRIATVLARRGVEYKRAR